MFSLVKTPWGFTFHFPGGYFTTARYIPKPEKKVVKSWNITIGRRELYYRKEIPLGHPSYFKEHSRAAVLPETIPATRV